uniref:YD repeat-containing protein n=1 Tax=Globodera pallida TaxID=36090 RepID=A0A183CTP0_GLOPA
KDDDTKSLWQASDSNQSYTNDYTTAYGQDAVNYP